MKTHTFLRWAGVLGCLAVAGCIRGPFRSAIAGDKESVAVQWTKANPLLTPISVPAGALTDILLVPADTVALLSINCVWRPLFDNAVMSDANDANERYIPAVVPSVFVIPLLAHAITLGYTWDYYVDLFGNRTEVRLKRLLAEERYSDALKLATEGSGIPTLNPTPTSGIFWAFPESEWASIANNTQKAWRKQWTKQISGLVSGKAEHWGNVLQTAASPEEWDKTAAKLSRLGAKLEGEVATWRALSVWRGALQKQDYATALSLLKQYPSVGFDGLPMRYADCVSKGFPKTFRAGLYDAGVLRAFDAEEFALLLKERETGILTHTKFRLPLETATPALNGSQEDLAAFLDATKGVAYAFAPVAAGNYRAVDALVKAKQPERLVQAIAQKLVVCDITTLVVLVEMGKTEEAQRLWATANTEVQAKVLAKALDEKETKGEQIISALSCPPQDIWKSQAQVQAFERLCRQTDAAMRQRVATLQKAGWVSEEQVKTIQKRYLDREAAENAAKAKELDFQGRCDKINAALHNRLQQMLDERDKEIEVYKTRLFAHFDEQIQRAQKSGDLDALEVWSNRKKRFQSLPVPEDWTFVLWYCLNFSDTLEFQGVTFNSRDVAGTSVPNFQERYLNPIKEAYREADKALEEVQRDATKREKLADAKSIRTLREKTLPENRKDKIATILTGKKFLQLAEMVEERWLLWKWELRD